MTPNTIILILSTLLFLELMFKPRLELTIGVGIVICFMGGE